MGDDPDDRNADRREDEVPPVPLPTYLWEEVRRSRTKGFYPWTHMFKPAFDEDTWLRERDHEYEPINPKDPPPPPILKVSEYEIEPRPATPAKTFERRYIKIPNEDAIIIPLHGESDEEINPDRYVDKEMTVQEMQDSIEERYFAPTPTTAEDSRADDEVHTSQVDSSALEALPLDRTARGIQTRLKSQAGRFRNKLRNISKPKISLPERPKIKFPDRPKINFPDRPQFLKEKPKFLTEKPKFLTEKPKFLTEKPKFLTERPKFTLPERPKFKLPERFSFDKAKKPPGPKQRRPNPSSLRRPLRDAITISSQSGSSKNIFETLKFKTYPRFLTRRKRERERAQQMAGTSLDTESSLPSTPPNRRKPHSTPWVESYKDIKFADDEASMEQKLDTQDEEGYEENTEPFHDSYVRGALRLGEEPVKAKMDSSSDVADSDKEQQSSGSSSMRRRAGVLEEIDSDEFFLRQKGLSREDMDVSRYLSKEIRDAFRSPKNALAHMDSEDYDEEEHPDIRFEEIPKPPERKKSIKSVQSEKQIAESDFNTFPLRPSRRKQSEPEFGSKEEFEKIRKPPRKYRSRSDTRQRSTPSLARSRSQGMEVGNQTPLPPKRRKSSKSLSRSIHESAGEIGADVVQREIDAHQPVAPFRKSRSRGTSLADEDRTSRGADSTDLPHDDRYFHVEEPMTMTDEHIVAAIPVEVVPLSSSTLDEEMLGYAVVSKDRKTKPAPPRPPPPPIRNRRQQLHNFQSQLHTIKNQGMNFFFTYPRRAIKSLHRTPVRPFRNYTTLGPSRPPRRSRVFREPVYVDSELPGDLDEIKYEPDIKMEYEDIRDLQSGDVVERMKGRPLPPPPRPPRKSKDDELLLQSTTGQMTDDTLVEDVDYTEEIQEEEEVPEIVEKPVYRKSKREEFLSSLSRINPFGSENRKSISKTEEKEVIPPHETIETSQQTSFEVAEVSVSIQTDPLPEGFIVDDGQSEVDGDVSQRSHSMAGRPTQRHTPVPRQIRESSIERELISQLIRSSESSREETSRRPKPERLMARLDIDITSESEAKSFESREETPPPLPERSLPSLFRNLPTFPVSFPDKLHLTELDVDKISVNEIQASKLQVSDMDANALQVVELNSKGGNLIVNGVELPPDFFKNLAAQFPVKSREPTPQPQIRRVLTPPPPIIVQHTASLSEYISQPQPFQASTTDHIPKPKTTKSRGRKSPTRVIDDSEDELASVMPEREKKEREQSTKKEEAPKVKEEKKLELLPHPIAPVAPQPNVPVTPPTADPSAFQLIKQLLGIWIRNTSRGTRSLAEGINSMFPEGEKRRDAQIAAIILLVLIASLILLGFGIDNSIHHHHWDYLPPR